MRNVRDRTPAGVICGFGFAHISSNLRTCSIWKSLISRALWNITFAYLYRTRRGHCLLEEGEEGQGVRRRK